MGDDRLDAQTSSRLLKRALGIKGSREKLAAALGAQLEELAPWLAGRAFPPQPVFEAVLGIILDADAGAPQTAVSAAPAGISKPRVLVADSVEGCRVITGILGDEFALVAAHALTDALDLVQHTSAAKHRGFAAIVCGQHFEGSQMLRFLECVKNYRATAAIPFVCCRSQPTQLSDGALGAMREACEALGALAYVDLSARTEAAAVAFRDAVRAAAGVKPAAARLRILVVDDNPDAAHTLSMLLGMAGHDAHKAAGGAEALRLGRELRPHAAILDIGMRDMSGFELARRMRAEPWGGALTLIALTGRTEPEDAARARAAGFEHHFNKPVTVERLLEALPKPGAA